MRLKILSWNIWYNGYFDEISKFLEKFDADIIGLQEVVPNDKNINVIGFLSNLGYGHVFSRVLEIRDDGRTMGNTIFSKRKILNSETCVLSEIESRNALKADVDVAGKILHIFSTHLLHTHQKPSDIQNLQTENLIKVLPREKTIVMGDFNATPESTVIKRMRGVLIDADPTLGSEATWSVYPEGCLPCNPQKLNIRLDYIFTTQDIKTSLFKIHQSKGSDHLPISVVVEI